MPYAYKNGVIFSPPWSFYISSSFVCAAATTNLVSIWNCHLNRKLVVNGWEYVGFGFAACPRYHANSTPCRGGAEENSTCAYFHCGRGHPDPGPVCFHPRYIAAAHFTNKLIEVTNPQHRTIEI